MRANGASSGRAAHREMALRRLRCQFRCARTFRNVDRTVRFRVRIRGRMNWPMRFATPLRRLGIASVSLMQSLGKEAALTVLTCENRRQRLPARMTNAMRVGCCIDGCNQKVSVALVDQSCFASRTVWRGLALIAKQCSHEQRSASSADRGALLTARGVLFACANEEMNEVTATRETTTRFRGESDVM